MPAANQQLLFFPNRLIQVRSALITVYVIHLHTSSTGTRRTGFLWHFHPDSMAFCAVLMQLRAASRDRCNLRPPLCPYCLFFGRDSNLNSVANECVLSPSPRACLLSVPFALPQSHRVSRRKMPHFKDLGIDFFSSHDRNSFHDKAVLFRLQMRSSCPRLLASFFRTDIFPLQKSPRRIFHRLHRVALMELPTTHFTPFSGPLECPAEYFYQK